MNNKIQILRREEVLKLLGLSRGTLYNLINEGTFVPPISLGARSVGFVQHEVNVVLAAMVEGRSFEERAVLVKDLVQQRQNTLSVFMHQG